MPGQEASAPHLFLSRWIAMNLLGLNGLNPPLTNYGKISQFFYRGCFPYKWSWFKRDLGRVVDYYHSRHGNKDYILVGFSAGGTLAHEVAAADPCCRGLIVHSGLWREVPNPRDIPILLVTTRGDRTPCDEATEEALEYYWGKGIRASHCEMPSQGQFIKHRFRNGLSVMQSWCLTEFGYELPVKPKYSWESSAGMPAAEPLMQVEAAAPRMRQGVDV